MDKWEITEYEVLDAQSHHYTSTSVSGGGGQVSNVNGVVQGHINPISSTTHIHRDQAIWVRILGESSESMLKFNETEVPARPGHRLVILTAPGSDVFERIFNRNTNMIHSLGIWNKWSTHDNTKAWIHGILYAVLVSIPFLGYIFFATQIHMMYFEKEHLWNRSTPQMRHKTLGLAFACANSYLLLFLSGSFGVTLLLAVGIAFFFAKTYVKNTLEIGKKIMLVSKEIDDQLDKFTNCQVV